MLDGVFKNSRKFLGVPLAILIVATIALVTGGIALGAVMHSVTVQTTVKEPLIYSYDNTSWNVTGDGEVIWTPELYACETQTAQVFIYNAANVAVPLSVWADSAGSIPGVSCTMSVWDADGNLTLVVPSHQFVTVDITVSAACGVEVPDGTSLATTWTVRFQRG